jgi:O-antigen/teichoic acid export membrane protein
MVVPPNEGRSEAARPSFARSSLLTYSTNVLVALLSLVNVLIVARVLGPEGRGGVAFLMAIALLTSTLATLGVEQSMVNVASAQPSARRALAGNALILAVLLGGVGIAIVQGLIAAFPTVGADSSPELRWLALAAIPVLVLQTFLIVLLQAEYRFALTNATWLATAVLNVGGTGVLAASGRLSVGTAVGTWVGAQALAASFLVWCVARRSTGFGRPDPSLARRTIAFGVQSHLGSVMSIGNYRLDQWILASLAGSRELGLYSVAVAWSEALFFLPTALAAVQRPDLVRAPASEAGRRAASVLRSALLVTVPLAAALLLLAPFLCVTVFGEEFRGSIDDLRVLVAGGFGIVALKLMTNALTARGKPMQATAAIAVAFVSTIALDALLIPSLGGLGAAIASTCAYVAAGVAAALIARRALGMQGRDFLPRLDDIRRLRQWGAGLRGRTGRVPNR